MGLAYCKSLCSSSKNQSPVDGRNGQAYGLSQGPQVASVVDNNVTTIQNAVETAATSGGRRKSEFLCNSRVDCEEDNKTKLKIKFEYIKQKLSLREFHYLTRNFNYTKSINFTNLLL
jgi:hypothetical protein